MRPGLGGSSQISGEPPSRPTRSGRRSSIFESNSPSPAASSESRSFAANGGLFHERDCCGVGNFGRRREVEVVARQDGAPRFDALSRGKRRTMFNKIVVAYTDRLRPNARSARVSSSRKASMRNCMRSPSWPPCRRIRRSPAPRIRHCRRRSRTTTSGSMNSCRRKCGRWRSAKGSGF